jgi:hypothetical protein
VAVDPARADIACFVGLVRCIPGAVLPPAVQGWLQLQGWAGAGPFARLRYPAPPIGMPPPPIAMPVTDIPIPIESYSAFTALFDAGGSMASSGTDYVATAVRTFFAQGGKRCYVVRMDDPVASGESPQTKQGKLGKLLPSSINALDDQSGWHGAGHVAGLPDVSFLAMPDLPVLTASTPVGPAGQVPEAPSGPAQFVECAPPDPATTAAIQYGPAAPRLSPDDYTRWAQAVQSVTRFLANGGSLREMLFVAAFPLPQHSGVAAAFEDPSSALTQDVHDVIAGQMPEIAGAGLSTAFLQLAYPWLRTTGSSVLLEGLEPPDGALTGLLARNALTRGTFTSAAKVAPAEIFDISPVLPAQETNVSAMPLTWGANSPQKPLIERLSLFGFTPSGLALLSDVTAYAGESYRPGRIHRLVAVIRRASRRLGEDVVFQSNGPLLWARVQSSLRQLMTRLWQLNALDGATASQAFSVRCDRSTMTQNDLDNGRLVAEVTFNAASTIELIRVTLALETSGTSAQSIAAEAS